MDPEDLEVKIVQKLVRRKVVGGHNKQIDTVKNWFRTSDQGRVEDRIEDMLADGQVIERYGSQRDAIRLVSMAAAKQYLRVRDGELPWNLREE
jgi:hypothetical protein